MTVAPISVTLDPGHTRQFSASGLTADGSSVDVTSGAIWTSNNPAIATIDASGLASAQSIGSATITAVYGSLSATATVTVRDPSPPVPAPVPPPSDPTVAPPMGSTMQFLYNGPSAIQTNVAAGAIKEERVSVLRGIVRSLNGQPLSGARITLLGHPELGQTLSRADGIYDFAINGGGSSTLVFEKSGFIPAQRTVATQWNEQAPVDDVVLVGYDSAATTVMMNALTAQRARANVASDVDGSRRATLIFPAGTGASLVMPDGSTTSVSSLQIRATEYTIGPNGPKAMPAGLPAMSAYTYCVELSADEAVSAGAAEVRFTKPVSFYIENFLGFPTGTSIPAGYYDRLRATWIGADNGRVVKVLTISGGMASLDVSGDGTADQGAALTALGIDDAERTQIASIYAAGQSLWRVRIPHFSPWDLNMPYAPPVGARPPNQPPALWIPAPTRACGEANNSIVDCANQTLGESVPIAGTPYSLDYNSARLARTQYSTTIQITGATVPDSVRRIELEINVAGQRILETFTPRPNMDYKFSWDGKDVYGREVQGATQGSFTIRYIYPVFYAPPAERQNGWALAGDNVQPLGPARAFTEVALNQTQLLQLGHFDTKSAGFGGWTFSAQRFYDGRGLAVIDSGGSERRADALQLGALAISTVAGNGQCCSDWGADGTVATQEPIGRPRAVAPAPDGTFYVTDGLVIGKVDRNGILTLIAGDPGRAGFTPDGAPAKGSPIDGWDVAVAPDGTLFFNDRRNGRVRKLVSGAWITVAGGGSLGADQRPVNGLLATNIAIDPQGITVAHDGTLYIADYRRVLRVDGNGVVSTVGGGNNQAISYVDGLPANEAYIGPIDVAVGRDGSIFLSDSNVVQRISPDGILHQVTLPFGVNGRLADGELSTTGYFDGPWGIDVAADGTLIVADGSGARVRAIAPNGLVSTIAGTGTRQQPTPAPDGYFARGADVSFPFDAKIAPDGSILIVDADHLIVRRTAPLFPAYKDLGLIVPSADGTEAYQFDEGRHTKTIDPLTGVTLETLAYDESGLLVSITDLDGNLTAIDRDASGLPAAIVSPGGQRTLLTMTTGHVTKIESPAGESLQFRYDAGGLLTQTIDRRGGVHTFTYGADGLLIKDEGPDGGFIALVRSGIGREYEVARLSAEGRTQRYLITTPGQTTERRQHVARDGTVSTSLFAGDRATLTSSDGTSVTTRQGPDARFGLLAPVTTEVTIESGSHTLQIRRSRAVTLSDPLNPLSLTSLTETVEENGKVWTSHYDAATRTHESLSPMGRRMTATLDAKGRLSSMLASGLAPVQVGYNERGLMSSVQQGERTMRLTYDQHFNVATITDPLSRTSRFSYDAAGRLTTHTLPDERVVSYSYDAEGNITSITPPARPAHTFTFTPVNRPQSYVPPAVTNGGSTGYTYNRDRQLTAMARPDGTTIALSYDSAARLQTLTAGALSLSYGYDTNGFLTSAAAPGQSLSLAYDGRFLSGVSWNGEVHGSVAFTYDDHFRIASEYGIPFGYDDDGLLIAAGALSLTRNPGNGLLAGTALGNFSDAYTYDTFGMPLTYTATMNGTPVFSQDFVYDDGGRVVEKSETLYGTSFGLGYEYDSAGRLSTVTRDAAPLTSYTYDANGNRLTRTSGATTESGAYDDQDRLLSYGALTYGHAGNGERTMVTGPAGTVTTNYDVLGNLRRVVLGDGTVIEYVLDAANRRVGKKVNGTLVRGWLYADALRIVAELDGNGAVLTRFVYASRANSPDSLIRDGKTYRIVHDHLGSPRLVLDAETGQVAQTLGYDEFGNVLSDSNPG
ncbi:MAG: Ig-like domain-containing protein, partial [Acidobacteriota bacterium]